MAGKVVTLDCPPAQAVQLAEALRTYVEAAYPPGGSPCAQVARETLLDTARQLAAGDGPATIPRRQRHLVRAAIAWYYGPDGPASNHPEGRILMELGEQL